MSLTVNNFVVTRGMVKEWFREDFRSYVENGIVTREQANQIYKAILSCKDIKYYICLGKKPREYKDRFHAFELIHHGQTLNDILKKYKSLSDRGESKYFKTIELNSVKIHVIGAYIDNENYFYDGDIIDREDTWDFGLVIELV